MKNCSRSVRTDTGDSYRFILKPEASALNLFSFVKTTLRYARGCENWENDRRDSNACENIKNCARDWIHITWSRWFELFFFSLRRLLNSLHDFSSPFCPAWNMGFRWQNIMGFSWIFVVWSWCSMLIVRWNSVEKIVQFQEVIVNFNLRNDSGSHRGKKFSMLLHTFIFWQFSRKIFTFSAITTVFEFWQFSRDFCTHRYFEISFKGNELTTVKAEASLFKMRSSRSLHDLLFTKLYQFKSSIIFRYHFWYSYALHLLRNWDILYAYRWKSVSKDSIK